MEPLPPPPCKVCSIALEQSEREGRIFTNVYRCVLLGWNEPQDSLGLCYVCSSFLAQVKKLEQSYLSETRSFLLMPQEDTKFLDHSLDIMLSARLHENGDIRFLDIFVALYWYYVVDMAWRRGNIKVTMKNVLVLVAPQVTTLERYNWNNFMMDFSLIINSYSTRGQSYWQKIFCTVIVNPLRYEGIPRKGH